MISLVLVFLICAPFLIYEDDNNFSQYITYSISLPLSYAILGLLGYFLVFLRLTFIPIYFFSGCIFFCLIFLKSYRSRFLYFLKTLFKEINFIFISHKNKIKYRFFYLLLFLLFIISIGPINHSDTANIYVGYPYQFWNNNRHFIDGNLNQGLLGIGDFANIFYFQDKTTWLIRTSQFLPLIFIFMLMIRRNTFNISIFIFLTSPVLIQWLTIGKTNFLSESFLALAFLVWDENKEEKYLSNIMSIILISIAFKISAILVCLPIFIYICFYYRRSIYQIKFKDIFKFISIPLVISLLALLTILFYRYYLTDNPLYPLFSSFFNKGDQQFLDWELTLKAWDRKGLFPLWIFIPRTFGKISFILGPANLFLALSSILLIIKNSYFRNLKLVIGVFQYLLLLLFCQGRADYYMSPVILISSGFPRDLLFNFDIDFLNKKINYFLKKLFQVSVFMQSIMFLLSSFYSIALVLYVIYDYENGMNKTAYNFFNSNKIQKIATPPVYNESLGLTLLYYDDPFIPGHKFNKCFYYNENQNEDQKELDKYKYCMQNLDIKTIIVDKDKLRNDSDFYCQSQFLNRISRNIFLEKKIEVDFCELN